MKRYLLMLLSLVWLAGLAWPMGITMASPVSGNDLPTVCDPTLTSTAVPQPAVTIELTPINGPIVISEKGGNYQYNTEIFNHSSTVQSFDVWMVVEGLGVSRTYGPYSMTLEPRTGAKHVLASQEVPAEAPAGSYTHTGYVVAACSSTEPCATAEPCVQGIIDSSSFEWQKAAPRQIGGAIE